ncbi:MAG: hypothetical protein A2782_02035 [Candidatus Blackburnbacteria bacterium RIFCSPHIGHO2_01_FULL_43_15b]|uniref:Uncharacterized protein n=1 Tax=Candidatus Blackburnbacteria bacterium RIFCSPHIGHO2_01_FULL_43_15b TaxID=1797513 RepID=A0A1G1UY01_9BACT|nr:MAG: hypothetical protein A2782_02035 [Candidatus Blackburnbacteria bacterium RIFCSPHIGHO2_01_FULL_43_15b]
MNDGKTTSDSLPWDVITKMVNEGEYKKDFDGITDEAFRFAVNDDNRSQVVDSAWKSLKKTDPNATQEQAEALADMMQILARMVIKKLEEKQDNT